MGPTIFHRLSDDQNSFNISILERLDTIMKKKYVCPCGYEYDPEKGDPENGIAPGTAWEDLPEDFVCPTCGLDKDSFEEEEAE